MLKNDYILQMILQIGTLIRKVIGLPEIERKDSLDDIEEAVGEAVNIDHKLLFSLDPDSMASLLSVGDVDEKLARFVSHAILLESRILEAEGEISMAQIRADQAKAIADAFGCELPGDNTPVEAIANTLSMTDGDNLDSSANTDISANADVSANTDTESEGADADLPDQVSKTDGTGSMAKEREDLQRRYAGSGISLDSLKMDL